MRSLLIKDYTKPVNILVCNKTDISMRQLFYNWYGQNQNKRAEQKAHLKGIF